MLTSIALLATLMPTAAQAPGDMRVALVIGNGAYAGSAALANPGNDARAMSATLRSLGFTVIEATDASRAQMTDAITKVRDQLRGKSGIGMLYYAGHGLQLDWRNYMVPIDAKLSKASDVPDQTVELGSVIDAFKQAGNRMNIVVLDACRDNPFPNTASAKGLAQLDAPPGTFLAFATAPGNVAEDGDNKAENGGQGNGLYTKFLLQELAKPQAKIEDVFKRVRLNVRQQSQGRQIPWESTSLEDDFFFNTGLKAVIKASDSEREKAFSAEKGDWDKIRDSKNVNDFYAFLQKYPNGNIASTAQYQIDKLQADKTVIVADQNGLKGRSFFNSARDGDAFKFEVRDGAGVFQGATTIKMRRIAEDQFEGVSDNVNIWGGATINSVGSLLFDGTGARYDPPLVVVPEGELKVGNRDQARSIRIDRAGASNWVDSNSKVVGRERIKTAFGEIETFKLEWEQVLQNGTRIKNTLWYDPDWIYAIRFIREQQSSNGRKDVRVREMVARERGKA